MKMRGPLTFYFDFVTFPLLGAFLFAEFCRSWEFVGWAAFGAVLFTFMEYWVHRIALHRFFYHGTHERHHLHPEEYVVFPIWYTPAIFVVFLLIFPIPVFTGLVVGFCWFIYWHHILHHFDLSGLKLIRRYAIWHLAHHRRDDVNFGITVSLWDWIFGTYQGANK